ncbi:MAG: hypothetical protein JF587_04060 [Catenulisporales bacterium]|nr:hypothetical protein [Catenulisporales bacterium]
MTTSGRKIQAVIGAFLTAIGFAIIIHTSIRSTDGSGAIVPGTLALGLGLALIVVAMIRDDDRR